LIWCPGVEGLAEASLGLAVVQPRLEGRRSPTNGLSLKGIRVFSGVQVTSESELTKTPWLLLTVSRRMLRTRCLRWVCVTAVSARREEH
jgi:hypothetical protein